MATATGRPPAMKSRKKTLSMAAVALAVGDARLGALEDAVAASPVNQRHLDRAVRHGDEAAEDDGVDDVHGRVDDRHPRLVADLAHHLDRHNGGVGEEGD